MVAEDNTRELDINLKPNLLSALKLRASVLREFIDNTLANEITHGPGNSPIFKSKSDFLGIHSYVGNLPKRSTAKDKRDPYRFYEPSSIISPQRKRYPSWSHQTLTNSSKINKLSRKLSLNWPPVIRVKRNPRPQPQLRRQGKLRLSLNRSILIEHAQLNLSLDAYSRRILRGLKLSPGDAALAILKPSLRISRQGLLSIALNPVTRQLTSKVNTKTPRVRVEVPSRIHHRETATSKGIIDLRHLLAKPLEAATPTGSPEAPPVEHCKSRSVVGGPESQREACRSRSPAKAKVKGRLSTSRHDTDSSPVFRTLYAPPMSPPLIKLPVSPCARSIGTLPSAVSKVSVDVERIRPTSASVPHRRGSGSIKKENGSRIQASALSTPPRKCLASPRQRYSAPSTSTAISSPATVMAAGLGLPQGAGTDSSTSVFIAYPVKKCSLLFRPSGTGLERQDSPGTGSKTEPDAEPEPVAGMKTVTAGGSGESLASHFSGAHQNLRSAKASPVCGPAGVASQLHPSSSRPVARPLVRKEVQGDAHRRPLSKQRGDGATHAAPASRPVALPPAGSGRNGEGLPDSAVLPAADPSLARLSLSDTTPGDRPSAVPSEAIPSSPGNAKAGETRGIVAGEEDGGVGKKKDKAGKRYLANARGAAEGTDAVADSSQAGPPVSKQASNLTGTAAVAAKEERRPSSLQPCNSHNTDDIPSAWSLRDAKGSEVASADNLLQHSPCARLADPPAVRRSRFGARSFSGAAAGHVSLLPPEFALISTSLSDLSIRKRGTQRWDEKDEEASEKTEVQEEDASQALCLDTSLNRDKETTDESGGVGEAAFSTAGDAQKSTKPSLPSSLDPFASASDASPSPALAAPRSPSEDLVPHPLSSDAPQAPILAGQVTALPAKPPEAAAAPEIAVDEISVDKGAICSSGQAQPPSSVGSASTVVGSAPSSLHTRQPSTATARAKTYAGAPRSPGPFISLYKPINTLSSAYPHGTLHQLPQLRATPPPRSRPSYDNQRANTAITEALPSPNRILLLPSPRPRVIQGVRSSPPSKSMSSPAAATRSSSRQARNEKELSGRGRDIEANRETPRRNEYKNSGTGLPIANKLRKPELFLSYSAYMSYLVGKVAVAKAVLGTAGNGVYQAAYPKAKAHTHFPADNGKEPDLKGVVEKSPALGPAEKAVSPSRLDTVPEPLPASLSLTKSLGEEETGAAGDEVLDEKNAPGAPVVPQDSAPPFPPDVATIDGPDSGLGALLPCSLTLFFGLDKTEEKTVTGGVSIPDQASPLAVENLVPEVDVLSSRTVDLPEVSRDDSGAKSSDDNAQKGQEGTAFPCVREPPAHFATSARLFRSAPEEEAAGGESSLSSPRPTSKGEDEAVVSPSVSGVAPRTSGELGLGVNLAIQDPMPVSSASTVDHVTSEESPREPPPPAAPALAAPGSQAIHSLFDEEDSAPPLHAQPPTVEEHSACPSDAEPEVSDLGNAGRSLRSAADVGSPSSMTPQPQAADDEGGLLRINEHSATATADADADTGSGTVTTIASSRGDEAEESFPASETRSTPPADAEAVSVVLPSATAHIAPQETHKLFPATAPAAPVTPPSPPPVVRHDAYNSCLRHYFSSYRRSLSQSLISRPASPVSNALCFNASNGFGDPATGGGQVAGFQGYVATTTATTPTPAITPTSATTVYNAVDNSRSPTKALSSPQPYPEGAGSGLVSTLQTPLKKPSFSFLRAGSSNSRYASVTVTAGRSPSSVQSPGANHQSPVYVSPYNGMSNNSTNSSNSNKPDAARDDNPKTDFLTPPAYEGTLNPSPPSLLLSPPSSVSKSDSFLNFDPELASGAREGAPSPSRAPTYASASRRKSLLEDHVYLTVSLLDLGYSPRAPTSSPRSPAPPQRTPSALTPHPNPNPPGQDGGGGETFPPRPDDAAAVGAILRSDPGERTQANAIDPSDTAAAELFLSVESPSSSLDGEFGNGFDDELRQETAACITPTARAPDVTESEESGSWSRTRPAPSDALSEQPEDARNNDLALGQVMPWSSIHAVSPSAFGLAPLEDSAAGDSVEIASPKKTDEKKASTSTLHQGCYTQPVFLTVVPRSAEPRSVTTEEGDEGTHEGRLGSKTEQDGQCHAYSRALCAAAVQTPPPSPANYLFDRSQHDDANGFRCSESSLSVAEVLRNPLGRAMMGHEVASESQLESGLGTPKHHLAQSPFTPGRVRGGSSPSKGNVADLPSSIPAPSTELCPPRGSKPLPNAVGLPATPPCKLSAPGIVRPEAGAGGSDGGAIGGGGLTPHSTGGDEEMRTPLMVLQSLISNGTSSLNAQLRFTRSSTFVGHSGIPHASPSPFVSQRRSLFRHPSVPADRRRRSNNNNHTDAPAVMHTTVASSFFSAVNRPVSDDGPTVVNNDPSSSASNPVVVVADGYRASPASTLHRQTAVSSSYPPAASAADRQPATGTPAASGAYSDVPPFPYSGSIMLFDFASGGPSPLGRCGRTGEEVEGRASGEAVSYLKFEKSPAALAATSSSGAAPFLRSLQSLPASSSYLSSGLWGPTVSKSVDGGTPSTALSSSAHVASNIPKPPPWSPSQNGSWRKIPAEDPGKQNRIRRFSSSTPRGGGGGGPEVHSPPPPRPPRSPPFPSPQKASREQTTGREQVEEADRYTCLLGHRLSCGTSPVSRARSTSRSSSPLNKRRRSDDTPSKLAGGECESPLPTENATVAIATGSGSSGVDRESGEGFTLLKVFERDGGEGLSRNLSLSAEAVRHVDFSGVSSGAGVKVGARIPRASEGGLSSSCLSSSGPFSQASVSPRASGSVRWEQGPRQMQFVEEVVGSPSHDNLTAERRTTGSGDGDGDGDALQASASRGLARTSEPTTVELAGTRESEAAPDPDPCAVTPDTLLLKWSREEDVSEADLANGSWRALEDPQMRGSKGSSGMAVPQGNETGRTRCRNVEEDFKPCEAKAEVEEGDAQLGAVHAVVCLADEDGGLD